MSQNLSKLVVFVPNESLDQVDQAIFEAGGGKIGNYEECHFRTSGIGTFNPNQQANPTIGESGTRSQVEEFRVEYLVKNHQVSSVLSAMNQAHPYEEVAYEIYPIQNVNPYEGAGMIGTLEKPMEESEFLVSLKKTFNCGIIRHTKLLNNKIKTVAVCGGSGSFLLKQAIRQNADIFISGDFKYHEFFDAENRMVIADIGHWESEQFTTELLFSYLTTKFPNFAVLKTAIHTNPVRYFLG
jgi:hypothetical protein